MTRNVSLSFLFSVITHGGRLENYRVNYSHDGRD